MKEAKQEAAGIIDQANKRANQIVDEAKQQAKSEGDRLKVSAAAEIEQEVNRAKEELRATVAGLALAGAEAVLEASIDEQANRVLVDKLAAQL
jgi:F-type H+-transporting ATPase subunit b